MDALIRPSTGPGAGELRFRRGLLLVVAASLFTGVLSGLARLGVLLGFGPAHAAGHGPLMVLGAFTTVIGLERAVALGQRWALVMPALAACAAVALLTGVPAAFWLMVLASAALCVLNLAMARRQPAVFTLLMLLGSLQLAWGAVAWALGRPLSELVLQWVGFFVLTIAAERLELSRLAPTPRWAHSALSAISLLWWAASAVPSLVQAAGVLLTAVGLWQLRFDLASRLVTRPGLPGFTAAGVLAGAAWLVVSGLILAWHGLPPAGPVYDAALHGVFVGYVLSMVMAHAPIILPAVAVVDVHFTRWAFLPLGVLHLGLAARVVGDLTGGPSLRQGGAVAGAVALLLYALTLLAGSLGSRALEQPRRGGRPAGVA